MLKLIVAEMLDPRPDPKFLDLFDVRKVGNFKTEDLSQIQVEFNPSPADEFKLTIPAVENKGHLVSLLKTLGFEEKIYKVGTPDKTTLIKPKTPTNMPNSPKSNIWNLHGPTA